MANVVLGFTSVQSLKNHDVLFVDSAAVDDRPATVGIWRFTDTTCVECRPVRKHCLLELLFKGGHRCIIPADAFFEPDWRTGKAIATRIAHADGEPLGIAGLWSWWKSPKGEMIHSFTMLTINAAGHPLMNQFHKPADEKRMVVILPPERYRDWLEVPVAKAMEFLRPYPADQLVAEVAPR